MTTKATKVEVIEGRVFSQIQIIKKILSKSSNFETYNDFIIIGEIVPKLPPRVLAELLQGLRAMNDELNKTNKPPSMNIQPLLLILARAQEEVADHLLNDFIRSSIDFPAYTIPI